MSQIIAKKSSRLNAKKQQKTDVAIDKSWRQKNIQVTLLYEQKIQQPPKVLKNFKVYTNSEDFIIGSHFIEALKHDGLVKQQSSISFYNKHKSIYIYGFYIPKDPRDVKYLIKPEYLVDDGLSIKLRSKKKIILDALIQEQRQKYEQNEDDKNNKATKQKKIGEVVEKVALWRKFYTGFYDELGNYIQKPLENAANQVGIAKKTLDDYLLQIRNGKKYGFNFNQKTNAKIGQLRAFVRQQKKKQGTK